MRDGGVPDARTPHLQYPGLFRLRSRPFHNEAKPMWSAADELAHAYHPDHSANFWIKLEQHLPDWRWRKDWLAENGIQVEGL